MQVVWGTFPWGQIEPGTGYIHKKIGGLLMNFIISHRCIWSEKKKKKNSEELQAKMLTSIT